VGVKFLSKVFAKAKCEWAFSRTKINTDHISTFKQKKECEIIKAIQAEFLFFFIVESDFNFTQYEPN